MKEWVKHSTGYLNINDDFVYVTKSGNWSEVHDLKEKNYSGFKYADTKSKLKVIVFTSLLGLLTIYGLASNIISGKISFLLIIGLPLLAYIAYQYMIPEFGASFKIPRSKIQSINIEEQAFTIVFIDFNNEETKNQFSGLNDKGISLISKIKDATNIN